MLKKTVAQLEAEVAEAVEVRKQKLRVERAKKRALAAAKIVKTGEAYAILGRAVICMIEEHPQREDMLAWVESAIMPYVIADESELVRQLPIFAPQQAEVGVG
jgi:hypothetical protein